MKNDTVSITFKVLLLIAFFNQNLTKELRQVQRCPSRAERLSIPKPHNCSSNQAYHCLLDDNGLLKETCNSYIQLPSGTFPRYSSYSDRVYYITCPTDRYQPWPVWSYEITECEFLKSKCSGLGQVVCNNGNAVVDKKCGCDYKSGYVPGGTSSCCSPSESTDCYCSFRPCNDDRQELNAGFQCVVKCQHGYIRPEGKNDCEMIYNTTRLDVTTRYDISYTYSGMKGPLGIGVDRNIPKMKRTGYHSVVTVLLLCAMIGIGCCCYILLHSDLVKIRRAWNEDCERRVYELIDAAKSGDFNTIKRIIAENAVDVYETDINKRSVLHLASCEGHLDVVKLLLSHAGYLETTDRCMKFTAIEDAQWHFKNRPKLDVYNEILSTLTKYEGEKRSQQTYKNNVTFQLIGAAQSGDVTKLKRMYALKTEMNLADSKGRTALHEAAEEDKLEAVKFLIDTCGVSPFSRLKSGDRPFDLTKNDGIKRVLRLAMEKHLNYKNEALEHGEHITEVLKVVRILKCAAEGNLIKLKSYDALNYNLSMGNYDKRTALHVAVANDQEHIVKYLLVEGKIKENTEDRWKVTPLMIAKERGKRTMFQLFLDHCPNVVNTESDEYKTYILLTAGKNGNVERLRQLNKDGIDMNLQNYDGRTALHLAVAEKKDDAVKYLKDECSCSEHITDRYGRTASGSMGSTDCNDSDFVKLQPTEPADSKIKLKKVKHGRIRWGLHDSKLKTGKGSRMNRTDQLEKSSKRIQITDKSNIYVIFEAAANGDLNSLKGCEYPYFDAIDYFKNTPLHVAASAGHMDVVVFLIEERNVSPFIRNSIRKRPLDLVNDGITSLVSMAGTIENINQRKRFSDVRKYLKKKTEEFGNADKMVIDKHFLGFEEDLQIFMLLNRTYKGDIVAVRGYLSKNPELINKQDYDGRTALHIAIAEMHQHLVKYFLTELKDEIDTNLTDRWENTPLQEANSYKLEEGDEKLEEYDQIIQLLKNHGENKK